MQHKQTKIDNSDSSKIDEPMRELPKGFTKFSTSKTIFVHVPEKDDSSKAAFCFCDETATTNISIFVGREDVKNIVYELHAQFENEDSEPQNISELQNISETPNVKTESLNLSDYLGFDKNQKDVVRTIEISSITHKSGDIKTGDRIFFKTDLKPKETDIIVLADDKIFYVIPFAERKAVNAALRLVARNGGNKADKPQTPKLIGVVTHLIRQLR